MQRLMVLHKQNKKEILFMLGYVCFNVYSSRRFCFVLLLSLLFSMFVRNKELER